MIQLVGIELYKIFSKWRTYISFLAIGVVVPIIQLALYVEGEHILDFMTQNLSQTFVFEGNFLNGYLTTQVVLNAFMIHIPFLVALVTGDLMAGEATAGTYRMLLTRPVSRVKLVTSKWIAGIIYTHSLVLWLAVVSLGLGVLIFGTGELIVIREEITIFAKNDILWRYIWAFGFAAISMTTVASLSFLFSSLVENSIGPIIGTMAIIIVFVIISAIDVSVFKAIKPYLFTNYMQSWRLFFDDPIDYERVYKNAGILVAHIAGFLGIALYLFKKRDITG